MIRREELEDEMNSSLEKIPSQSPIDYLNQKINQKEVTMGGIPRASVSFG